MDQDLCSNNKYKTKTELEVHYDADLSIATFFFFHVSFNMPVEIHTHCYRMSKGNLQVGSGWTKFSIHWSLLLSVPLLRVNSDCPQGCVIAGPFSFNLNMMWIIINLLTYC